MKNCLILPEYYESSPSQFLQHQDASSGSHGHLQGTPDGSTPVGHPVTRSGSDLQHYYQQSPLMQQQQYKNYPQQPLPAQSQQHGYNQILAQPQSQYDEGYTASRGQQFDENYQVQLYHQEIREQYARKAEQPQWQQPAEHNMAREMVPAGQHY